MSEPDPAPKGHATRRRTVLTYGTFDLFHIGHLRLIERLCGLGDRLVVGVSTDDFNAEKGKKSVVSYEDRAAIVDSIKGVDRVIPEESWAQKERDIAEHQVDVFAIGEDWRGRFDHLEQHCQVVYLPRTQGVSSTEIKRMLQVLDPAHLDELQDAVNILANLLTHYRDLT